MIRNLYHFPNKYLINRVYRTLMFPWEIVPPQALNYNVLKHAGSTDIKDRQLETPPKNKVSSKNKVLIQHIKNKDMPRTNHTGSGKKFEQKKVRIAEKSNFFPLELFSSNFFLVHMEAEVLQQWQTTHFKACSK